MTGGREHEAGVAAEQVGAAVAAVPRADVVGAAGHDVGVDVHLAEVDRRAQHGQAAGLGQRVVQRHRDEVAVQAGRHAGGVGVPDQDVEGGRPLAQQVVVDPVVPDQVIGTQPGEDAGQRLAVEVALAL